MPINDGKNVPSSKVGEVSWMDCEAPSIPVPSRLANERVLETEERRLKGGCAPNQSPLFNIAWMSASS
jgi:hypothetical protein